MNQKLKEKMIKKIEGKNDKKWKEKIMKKIEQIVSNFNSSNKKFLNKITFKNFVNDILIAYFG